MVPYDDHGGTTMDVNNKRARWLVRALCAGVAAVGAVAAGQPAHAYTLETSGSCTEIKWASPSPVYKIHIYEFFDGGGDADDLVDMFAAVYDVMREFNNVGGTTAKVDVTGITSDARAYESDTPFNDTAPTIHIGFTNDPTEVSSSGKNDASTKFKVDPATCTYNEVRITFQDLSLVSWNFGTPADAGDPYYRTTDMDSTGKRWFKPVMLHELLHSFGLDHSGTTYSFMNYYALPWAGGGVAETSAIRPLPDDARALRHLYPGTSTRAEVAVLTTWYDKDHLNSRSAMQASVCAPSRGNAFPAGPFDSYYCGTGGPNAGSTTVCAGDQLFTEYAFANYSTDTADDINVRMYLSTDDVYDSSDLLSPTAHDVTVESGHSHLVTQKWEVPSGLTSGTSYHVIIDAIGTTSSGNWVDDWTPLVAPVTAC
jgi:hypothetical protein